MKRSLLIIAILGAAVAVGRADDVKTNWKHDCAMCHGADGNGDTPAGRHFGVSDYTDPKVQEKFTDKAAFNAIKQGIRKDGRMKMRAFAGKLTDAEIHDLIKYLRSFKKGKDSK
jgi:cytochrome c6